MPLNTVTATFECATAHPPTGHTKENKIPPRLAPLAQTYELVGKRNLPMRLLALRTFTDK